MTEPGNALEGWKAIADYLGKSVRSVQRWEVVLGLPIHRRSDEEGGTVFAYTTEIDDWRRAQGASSHAADDSEEPRSSAWSVSSRSRLLAAVIGVVACVLLGVAVERSVSDPRVTASTFRLVDARVEGLSATGAVLWSYAFPHTIGTHLDNRLVIRTADLDGDGEAEVIVPVRFVVPGLLTSGDEIYCFSRGGVLKWRLAVDHELTIGGRRFRPPWALVDIAIPKTAPPRRAWFAFSQPGSEAEGLIAPSWPGLVIEISPSGEAHLKLAFAGSILGIEHWVTPAGGYLAIGGASAAYHKAALVLVRDDDSPSTFTRAEPGEEFMCATCPIGQVRKLILSPSTDIGVSKEFGHASIGIVREYGLRLWMQLREEQYGSAIVVLNPDFSIESFGFAARHWVTHRLHEQSGRLTHSDRDCPERDALQALREWTPDGGWRELRVRASMPHPPPDWPN